MKIHVFMTGGTIDSHWDGRQDATIVNTHSIIPEYLKAFQLHDSLEFTELFMKDSRIVTNEDRKKLVDAIAASSDTHILVTHGTYTLLDTALFLSANLTRKNQTIVVTGAKTPIKGFESSEGLFNLGYALASLQREKPGIYVCLHGKCFDPHDADKFLAVAPQE